MTKTSVETIRQEIEELRRLIVRDPLTGLYSGLWFRQNVVGRSGWVLLADLDGFKEFQDRRGSHRAGDQVLSEFARFLEDASGGAEGSASRCLVARLHGDEFAVWAPSRASASALREAVLGWVNREGGVTASAGIGQSLEQADQAMYRCKRRRPRTARARGA